MKNKNDTGPMYIKLGKGRKGSVLYPEGALYEWLGSRAVGSGTIAPPSQSKNRFLREKQVAEITGLSIAWLRRKRWEGARPTKENES